jgi:hydrogenase maturation protein HypF
MALISRIINIGGMVQGVGFRPFVARTAMSLDITGTVRNTPAGVQIRANGSETAINEFISRIRKHPPELAYIDSIDVIPVKNKSIAASFTIIESISGNKPSVEITPDSAVCSKCLREMNSPKNRRFGHPFINCTDCGPRYSVVYSIPYDRKNTAMKNFNMCSNCAQEYKELSSRFFHAQPVCCPDCGPRLELFDSLGNAMATESIIETVKSLLASEKIVAIKGIGGFHLACMASSHKAVNRLRDCKSRAQKPFACMVRDLKSAEKYAKLTSSDRALLTSARAPIVILQKSISCDQLLSSVSPGLSTIGLMLPYTPVHHLIFQNMPYDCLVMTSANENGEPMYIDVTELLQNKRIFCDAVLSHDRPIAVRLDDSVVRPVKNGSVILRRARGFVPSPVKAPFPLDGIIGLGAQMKNSIAVGHGKSCFVSEYMGTTDSVSVVNECVKTLGRILNILQVKPHLMVSDLHPSSIDPRLFGPDLPCVKVQHHHAHAAACMGEHGLKGKAISVIYDGTGFGDDGTLWGSEILISDYASYKRMAHLFPMPLVGNEAAIENPGRLALAICADKVSDNSSIVPWMSPEEQAIVLSLMQKPDFITRSTGMGRLFDACAALLGRCTKRNYEGQPAIELEGCAEYLCDDHYPVKIEKSGDKLLMDGPSVLLSVIEDRNAGVAPSIISARFHNTIVQMTIQTVSMISEHTGIDQVVLSGGCFSNKILLDNTVELLEKRHLKVYFHKQLPPGDECISYGQVLIAGRRGKRE